MKTIGQGRPGLRNQNILSGPRTLAKGNADKDVYRRSGAAAKPARPSSPGPGGLRTALPPPPGRPPRLRGPCGGRIGFPNLQSAQGWPPFPPRGRESRNASQPCRFHLSRKKQPQ